MSTPSKVLELVERFDADLNYYRSPRYKETETRQEFIDPLFEALGWDIGNKRGAAAAFREVILEFSMKTGGTHHAPDYLFRAGPQPKFFVEAKKPWVNLRDGVAPAYQVQRYAWTAKLPLSVLTDFDEFAIYDCRAEPQQNAPAAAARYRFYTYQDYATKWDEIAELFHHDSVLGGSLEKFAQVQKAPKGAIPVDKAFLTEIDGWRAALARNIYLWDKTLTTRDLNYAVQMTLDRIIFLRICEDRGIEPYGHLQELAKGGQVYAQLLNLFRDADDRYNSGLFHFEHERGREEPDTLTPNIYIDDEPLRKIINGMYFPQSPYEFSVMPVEVLGQVYEQFLGKVITIGARDKVEVEEKPEVRKAGGVYYTPEYIVNYIVANTVGKLVEGKTPKQVEALRIADIACGSGSFLIGAYQYLIDWHIQQYLADGAQKHKKRLYRVKDGDWRLTTEERKRILVNNIYGVDLDAQAVEVTKLSLCLKMLEGETSQSLVFQHQFARERVLPDLNNNIKCGNSLIGPDIYQMDVANGLSDEELYIINAFDWEAEFPEVMRAGGFDAIIGNPPYLGGREWKEEGGRRYDYFVKRYAVAEYQFDIYALFWEQGIKLLRQRGRMGFITPNTWLNNQSNTKLRQFLLEHTKVAQIVDYSRLQVFADAVVLPIVTILEKVSDPKGTVEIYTPGPQGVKCSHTIPQQVWALDPYRIFNIALRNEDVVIRQRIEAGSQSLESLAQVKFGIKLYETGKGKPPQAADAAKRHIFEANTQLEPDYRRYLEGKDVSRYVIDWRQRWLKYGPNLAAPRDPALFTGKRLLFRRIVGERLIGTFTEDDYVTSQLLQIVKPHDEDLALFLLGVLNSSLMAYYFRKKYNRQDKTFPEIRIYELCSLPIRQLDFANPADRTCHDQMLSLVEKMLDLNKRLPVAKTNQERTVIQRQIEATEGQIDRLVYELYGLTADEIAVVETATKR
jgi:type I restriction-modification system DNA methylase subunit